MRAIHTTIHRQTGAMSHAATAAHRLHRLLPTAAITQYSSSNCSSAALLSQPSYSHIQRSPHRSASSSCGTSSGAMNVFDRRQLALVGRDDFRVSD